MRKKTDNRRIADLALDPEDYIARTIVTNVVPLSSVRGVSSTENSSRHIGCPLWWLKVVYPIVRGKNELIIALYLYRQQFAQKGKESRIISVTNVRLMNELGIDRYAKYRALKSLEDAGLITIHRDGRKSLGVTFCQPYTLKG